MSVTQRASNDGRTLFVGRQAELSQVAEALVAARHARPQVVVVEGEAGIGKTAFLRRCQGLADGFVVLEAVGDESEIGFDRGVVSQLVARAGVSSDPGPPIDHGASPSSPFAAGAELLSLLGSLQDGGPVLLVLDDAHWIDPPSAAAVLFALRRLYADRVCALIATRPGGDERGGPGWSRFLDDGERARRIRLGGLDEQEVRAFVGSLVSTPLHRGAVARLREHTDGHPLYIRALVDELPAQSLNAEHGPLPAPHSFAATVLARLATLSPAARDLAAAAAVSGPRCRADRALAAAGLDGTLTPLDEVLAAGVVVLVPGRLPAEIQFAHPLTRAAVYDDLSPSRRRDLHLALARLTDGPESLAHRVDASHGADDELAAELAGLGGDEVIRGRLTAGVDHLMLASRIAADRELGERALLRAVDALGLAGDVPRARELRDAVERCADSPRRSFVLGCMVASLDGALDEPVEQLLAVTRRRDLADDPELTGPLTSSLAIICAYAGRGPEAIEWARRTLSEQTPAPAVALTARQGLALGLAHCGRERDAIEALASPALSPANPTPFDVELAITRGAIKAQAGDLRGAVDDLTAVIGWSRAGPASRGLPNAYASLADAEYRLGRWQHGAAHAELAVSLARDSDQVWELPFAHATASLFDVGRGEWPAAEQHAQDAACAARLAPLPLAVFYARLASANLACARGEPDRALELLAALWDELPAAVVPALRRRTYELEVEALLRAGRLDAAAALLDRPEPESPGWWRLSAVLAHARGNIPQARDAFVRGQDAAAVNDSPLTRGAFELAYGHFLRRTGRRGAAAARLRTARELLEPLGARPLLARCDVELSACGVRPNAGGTEDLGLTSREAAVAALVAAGRSNREAGAELYLSTKAIEYHLSNIFAKLGIRSRHELAARLPERDPA